MLVLRGEKLDALENLGDPDVLFHREKVLLGACEFAFHPEGIFANGIFCVQRLLVVNPGSDDIVAVCQNIEPFAFDLDGTGPSGDEMDLIGRVVVFLGVESARKLEKASIQYYCEQNGADSCLDVFLRYGCSGDIVFLPQWIPTPESSDLKVL